MSEERKITIIEAMKEIKTLAKRVQKNYKYLTDYCCGLSNEKPVFETEKKQVEEVKSIEQSCIDLVDRMVELNMRIQYTNLMTSVQLEGKTYRITHLLYLNRQMGELIAGVYKAIRVPTMAAARSIGVGHGDTKVEIVRFYEQKERDEKLRKIEDLVESIDPRMETINATTELLELPEVDKVVI